VNGGSSDARPPTSAGPGAGVLEVEGVTVRFGGVTALDDVSFTAPARQVTGIIGPNGAGKTTLLNVLCGFVRPDAGRLRFDGAEVKGLRPHRLASLGIARTLQGVGLFRHLSVLENVMVGAEHVARAGFWSALAGLPAADRRERMLRARALEALDRVGAPDLADRMPDQLAFGLRKRVALARAVVGGPRLLLLDEPTRGVDVGAKAEIYKLIEEARKEGMAILVASSELEELAGICHRIVVLRRGRIADELERSEFSKERIVSAAAIDRVEA
jgi:branched-chain amino acid transport system ATP-binding protein